MPGHGKSVDSGGTPAHFYQTYFYGGLTMAHHDYSAVTTDFAVAWLNGSNYYPTELTLDANHLDTMDEVETGQNDFRHSQIAACETEIVSITVQTSYPHSLIAFEIVAIDPPRVKVASTVHGSAHEHVTVVTEDIYASFVIGEITFNNDGSLRAINGADTANVVTYETYKHEMSSPMKVLLSAVDSPGSNVLTINTTLVSKKIPAGYIWGVRVKNGKPGSNMRVVVLTKQTIS
jgi:hypothetical protein